jgi:serine/threonine protein kinase
MLPAMANGQRALQSQQEMDSTALPRGTRVGAWRVHGIGGRGTFGTVYSAVSDERSPSRLVALKLAVHPADPRFEREAELLSRIRHPSVPRLLDWGQWRAPSGSSHPFVVMEWLDAEPLYEWAARRNPSSRQVLALLAQATGALQATHEVGGVHRDVKGANVLVRPSDGRLFLTDFGAGYFAGASRLTPLNLMPGTPAYRSPEQWDAFRRAGPNATSPALAQPADDVFALGVMAYRLVTDTYPPFTRPDTKEGQCWLPGGTGAPPPRQLNPRVDAQLNALILRMLSPRPEDRGAAGELSTAMERGATHAGPTADELLFDWETLKPSEWTEADRAEAAELGHRPRRRSRERTLKAQQEDAVARARAALPATPAPPQAPAGQLKPRSRLPWLAAVLALGLWPSEPGSISTDASSTAAHSKSKAPHDAVSLGDTAQNSSAARPKDPATSAIAQELPKTPLPGQLKPDANGRCPTKLIAINGGCWVKVELNSEECPSNGFKYRGGCYMPFLVSQREPTSAPQAR